MKKAIILHGTEGSPEGNWFRWLEAKLKAKGVEVWLPALPKAERPSLREWRDFVEANCPFPIDDDTVVIGHSSGAALSLVLSGRMKLGALVAVSPFVPFEKSYSGTKWDANSRLFDVDFNWSAIKTNSSKRLVICSDDDPYIPANVFRYISEQIDAETVLVPEQGHFNLEKSEIYHEFPLLLSLLMERGIVSHGIIQIVDENDTPVGSATMQEAQTKGLWHRIARVIVEDEHGNVLLQKRAPTMLMNPGRWDTSCSGHVDAGEDWLEAAKRELAEEIGLEHVELSEMQRSKTEAHEPDGRILRRFNVLYRTVVPRGTHFTVQPEEVTEVRWFSIGELRRLVTDHPDDATHSLRRMVEDFYESH